MNHVGVTHSFDVQERVHHLQTTNKRQRKGATTCEKGATIREKRKRRPTSFAWVIGTGNSPFAACCRVGIGLPKARNATLALLREDCTAIRSASQPNGTTSSQMVGAPFPASNRTTLLKMKMIIISAT